MSVGLDRIHEADNIRSYTADVRNISTPGPTHPIEIRRGFLSRVKVFQGQVTSADEVVIAENDSGYGREEDGICRKVGREVIRGAQEVPRAHAETDNCANITTTANVEVAREQSCHIGTLTFC